MKVGGIKRGTLIGYSPLSHASGSRYSWRMQYWHVGRVIALPITLGIMAFGGLRWTLIALAAVLVMHVVYWWRNGHWME